MLLPVALSGIVKKACAGYKHERKAKDEGD